MVHRHPEVAFGVALERGVERRAAGVQVAQRGRAQVGARRRHGHHAAEHGGHALQDADARVRQRLERVFGVEAAAQHQAGARMHGGHQHRGNAEDVRHG
ncbi:hypothetical protein G6F22_020258 [Rhizopus arrhizus]|nr:hypothetical protein G6F22_020258 [Rhizopus arrhizus]